MSKDYMNAGIIFIIIYKIIIVLIATPLSVIFILDSNYIASIFPLLYIFTSLFLIFTIIISEYFIVKFVVLLLCILIESSSMIISPENNLIMLNLILSFNSLLMIFFLAIFFSIYSCFDNDNDIVSTIVEKNDIVRNSEESNISDVETIVVK